MKKTVIALISALALGSALNFAAAKEEPTIKEVVERTAKKVKAEKVGKQKAKELSKDNWKAMEGSAPIEKQQADAYAYEQAKDDDMQPYFYSGEAEYTSNNKGAAYKFAYQNAIMTLIEAIEINMAGGSSSETNDVDGFATTKGSSAFKSIAAKKLAGLQPVVKIYKKEGNKYSVSVRVFYSRKLAQELEARDEAKKIKSDDQLKKDVENQLDKLLKENE